MNQGRYLIEELCGLTGFSRRTVRYYVQEGLVDPPAGRGRGGYYSDRHVAQLARIRRLQDEGYRLEAIRGRVAAPAAADAALPPGQSAPSIAPAPERALRDAPPAGAMGSSWTRHVVARGVELHLSAEAGEKLGPAVATALAALRSIVERQGGRHE
jgi:DNA-binding transcriptional MerR regulator